MVAAGKNCVSYDITLYVLFKGNRRFGRTCLLHVRGERVIGTKSEAYKCTFFTSQLHYIAGDTTLERRYNRISNETRNKFRGRNLGIKKKGKAIPVTNRGGG
jgi:hypothetical protein